MSDDLGRALGALPHGPEFRFLDRLTELDPGRSGAGDYLLRGDEPFLKGHFPKEPMFPGVLLVEAIAQLAGTVAQSDPERPPLDGLKLTAMRNVKITGTARPGETVVFNAEITGRMGQLVQAKGTGKVNGEIVVQADVVLAGEQPTEPAP